MLERRTASVASLGSGKQVKQQILVLSRTRLLREGVAEAMQASEHLEIIGLIEEIGQAIKMVRDYPGATILLDAAFPKALEALTEAHQADAAGRVVVFNLSETEEDIVAWVKAGADGYIPNAASAAEVVRYVESILRGEQICSGAVALGLMRTIRSSSSGPTGNGRPARSTIALTSRESEIVGMIAAGLCNKEIARKLDIELSTTKSHVHNLLSKLALRGRTEVAQWAQKRADPDA